MKKPGLTVQIFAGLLIGILLGWLLPDTGKAIKPLADVFLHLVKSIIAPLVFATLVVGIAGHKSMKTVGRLGLKSIIFFEFVTTFALAIGLFAANIFQPGAGVNLANVAAGEASALAAKQPTVGEIIVHTIPASIVDSMARGDVLQIVVFSIIFAAAVSAAKADVILNFCNSLAEVMFKYTAIVMKFAPIGVAAAMAATVGEHGVSVLVSLGKLVGTLYLALFVFIGAVLVPTAIIAKVPLRKFINAVKEPALLAFSTTSSEAALPKALLAMEAIGVPRNIVSFVLPVGYTFNLTGTTLYLSLAAPFVAQAAGVHMSIQQQIMMMLTLMLTSKGVAAVPRASLVILAGTLSSFNLPLTGVTLILGVDTVMDMARTSVNVIGNCLASVVLARWEGVYCEPGSEALLVDPMVERVVNPLVDPLADPLVDPVAELVMDSAAERGKSIELHPSQLQAAAVGADAGWKPALPGRPLSESAAAADSDKSIEPAVDSADVPEVQVVSG